MALIAECMDGSALPVLLSTTHIFLLEELSSALLGKGVTDISTSCSLHYNPGFTMTTSRIGPSRPPQGDSNPTQHCLASAVLPNPREEVMTLSTLNLSCLPDQCHMDDSDKFTCQVSGITFCVHMGSTDREQKVNQGYNYHNPKKDSTS